MVALRSRLMLLALVALPTASALFSTTLHGAPTEVIEPGTPGAATLTLQPWLTTYDQDAVCNDGSPAGYYFKPGSDSKQWLVYLEGGYWCWDEESCTERYQTDKFDMSSTGWKSEFAQEGIFGTDPSTNPFANVNMIFVKYCSSDSWFGDAPASSTTFNFAFRGARIVNAVMTALVQAHGLGSSGDREFLLLGGCSAGGRGVLTNLDAFAGAAPPNVNVRGLLDAAGWVDVQPIIPDMLSLQQMSMDLFAFAQPNIPPSCANQYSGSEGWKCLWPSYRLPFVETEYFLNAAQYDAFQIMYDTNNLDSEYCCEQPAQQQWVDQFQTATLALLHNVPSTCGVYSSTCLVHCLSCNADWYSFMVDGKSLASSVASWYFAIQPLNDVSQCQGWDCTLQCSGGPWEPTNTPCQTTTNQCANSYMEPPPAVNYAASQQMGAQVWASQQTQSSGGGGASQPNPFVQHPGVAPAQAAQMGAQVWASQQTQSNGGGDAGEPNPYVQHTDVAPAQAAELGNQAWEESQATYKAEMPPVPNPYEQHPGVPSQQAAANGDAIWWATQSQSNGQTNGQPNGNGQPQPSNNGQSQQPAQQNGGPQPSQNGNGQNQAAQNQWQQRQAQQQAWQQEGQAQTQSVAAVEPSLSPEQQQALQAQLQQQQQQLQAQQQWQQQQWQQGGGRRMLAVRRS